MAPALLYARFRRAKDYLKRKSHKKELGASHDARRRFLRVTVEVEVKTDEGLTTLVAAERKIRDNVLRYLSNLRVEATLGETNRLRIRDGIIERINPLLGETPVIKSIFFPDFVVE